MVADRYQVLHEISRGGMGIVLLARDVTTGRELALKRCLPDPRGDLFKLLFRREYQTLASLRHPRIIEVYDYGVEDGNPFYTMELLGGHDLAELVPIPWRKACGYLRDVATSLLLLHQRQLLHRDLSPRNVRLSSDGHCKLLDFGTLSSFGVPSDVAGTVALMPPELVRGLSLDQRADLFSLGALAYYMLTGRQAFRAKQISELEAAWTVQPAPPSKNIRERAPLSSGAEGPAGPATPATPEEREEPLPAALDELILGLLSVDTLARPASAAEVIDKLTSIAGLPDDGEALSPEHYLSSPLVGRDAALASVQALLERTEARGRDRTGGLLIEGASGTGVSRLLRELAVRAQITGATVVAVSGSACQGPYSAIRALVRTFFEVAPRDAQETIGDDGPVLLRAFPELAERLPRGLQPTPSLGNPGVFRAQLQAAITGWWLRLGAKRRLVIAVDDIQAMDESSAAALVGLSIDGADGRAMVAFGRRNTDPFAAEAVLRALKATAAQLSLGDLGTDGMAALVRALLGDVRHAARFTDWLRGLTGGNPGQSIELVRYLVTSGVVRHREGVWILPQDLGGVKLPPRMDRAQSERLGQLGPLALRLAEVMSLHDGPLSLELCAMLLENDGQAEVLGALDELVRASVLRVSGATYYFAQELLRNLVRARLSREEQRLLHGRLARCLLATATATPASASDMQSRMAAGFHLVHAGEEQRGADLLREAALDLVDRHDDMLTAAPALEAALRIYRAENRPPREQLELLMPLCFAGYYVDRRLADRHGRAMVHLGEELTGLRLARNLRPFLGKHLSTWFGLLYGAIRFLRAPELGGIQGFKNLVRTLTTCIVFLAAKCAICLEVSEAEWLADRLEPLTALGRRHAATLSHRYAVAMSYVTRGHAARVVREFGVLLEELRHPEKIRDFPMEALTSLRGGALYALGAIQSFRDTPEALHTADELELLGHRIYDLAADQVRTTFYACRGDLENAAFYRRKLEAHALTNGSVWQAEVWAPSSQILADIATDDVIGTKRTWNELSRLGQDVPSLRRYEVGARLVYLLQTGREDEALEQFPALFQGAQPNGFIGWTTSRGSLACVYNTLGRHEEARTVCVETLALLEPGDLDFVALNLRVELQLAYAEIGLGRLGEAIARLEALAERHGPNAGRVTMGQIHLALADAAIAGRDMEAFERHAAIVDGLYYPTKNPALAGQAARLRLRGRFAGLETKSSPRAGTAGTPARARLTAWARALEACPDVETRARVACRLIVEQTGALRGFLFRLEGTETRLLASSSPEPPSSELIAWANAEFARFRDETLDLAESMRTEIRATTLMTTATSPEDPQGPPVVFHPIMRSEGGNLRVVTLCVLERGKASLLPLEWDLSLLVAGSL